MTPFARWPRGPRPMRLTPEQSRVVFLWMRDFRRAGHALEPEARAELERIRARVVELEIAFNRNINEFVDGIDVTRDELDGLPDDFIERLSPGSAPETLRVSLDYPEVYPFLAQAANRAAREALFRKHWSRAEEQNRPLLAEALRLRQQAAALLGHATWAHYAIEVKMAETPEAVAEFYDELVPRLDAFRDRELAVLTARFHADGHDGPLAAWDWAYYDEQLRRARVRGGRKPRGRVPPPGGVHQRHVRPHRRGVRSRIPSSRRCPGVAPVGGALRDGGP